jgi:hypothetical protein
MNDCLLIDTVKGILDINRNHVPLLFKLRHNGRDRKNSIVLPKRKLLITYWKFHHQSIFEYFVERY